LCVKLTVLVTLIFKDKDPLYLPHTLLIQYLQAFGDSEVVGKRILIQSQGADDPHAKDNKDLDLGNGFLDI
jgi:hypothetical protein